MNSSSSSGSGVRRRLSRSRSAESRRSLCMRGSESMRVETGSAQHPLTPRQIECQDDLPLSLKRSLSSGSGAVGGGGSSGGGAVCGGEGSRDGSSSTKQRRVE